MLTYLHVVTINPHDVSSSYKVIRRNSAIGAVFARLYQHIRYFAEDLLYGATEASSQPDSH
jgi:hypothetical protein